MSVLSLPYWYLNTDTKLDGKLTESEWTKLIEERLLLLKEKDRKNYEYGLSKYDKQELGKKERQAFTILKLGVCLDPRLSMWLVETEGDLFERDFRNLKWDEKKSILTNLYPKESGKENWIEVDELSLQFNEDLYEVLDLKKRTGQIVRSGNPMYRSATIKDVKGMGNYIALDYRFVSELIKSRKITLYKGWAIGTISRFVTTIKHHYQKTIEKSLTSIAERIEDPRNILMKNVAEKVNELLQDKVEFRKSSLNIGNIKLVGGLEENISILPPCIEDLLNQVNEIGYIGHWERLQLGIFLKMTGMDVDQQLKFWHAKAVDNINISYDDFLKKAGYVIRHIYGLEGGRVDYQMPSCSTIQAKMYCTFRHTDIENVNKRVLVKLQIFSPKESKDKSLIAKFAEKKIIAKRILDATSNGLPTTACAYHLELVSEVKTDKVNHPMYYLARAGSKLGGFMQEEPNEVKTKDE